MTNLVNKTFGRLTVIGPAPNKKGYWLCRCSCGNLTTVLAGNLTRGHTKSCGCLKLKDLTGQRFGKLTVINKVVSNKRSSSRWLCNCDCGNTIVVYSDSLQRGSTTSCGCLRRELGMPQEIKALFVQGTMPIKIGQMTKSNKSGVVGVNWDKSHNKWQASIRFKGHKYNLGRYDKIDDAIKARQDAQQKILKEDI